jgi:hypothetical protein
MVHPFYYVSWYNIIYLDTWQNGYNKENQSDLYFRMEEVEIKVDTKLPSYISN